MGEILRHLVLSLSLGMGFACLASIPASSTEADLFVGKGRENGPDTPGSATPPADYACTQVLGFSQTLEWYGGLSLADHMARKSSPELHAGAFLPGWQGIFFVGASIGKWLDLDFRAWSGTEDATHEAAAHCSRDEVDRVVFNVSGEERSADEWAQAVALVAIRIRENFPAVRTIVMQAAVGAPEGECGEIRTARNHPEIVKGIRRAAARNKISEGPAPKVADCDHFRDRLGHLTAEGAEHVRNRLKAHYRETTRELRE